ncbi:hypothetical protein JCM8097_005476 [Rhodosporidiobolus ruineniae]
MPAPAPTRVLWARGGAAAGDPSHNPSASTYAATPPSSTYTGPKVAGTYGGFVGVLVGAGIFVLVVLAILALLRYRSIRRKNRQAGEAAGQGGVRDWAAENDDAFEMPSSLRTPQGEYGYGTPGGGGGGGGHSYTQHAGYPDPYSSGGGFGGASSSTVHLSPYADRQGVGSPRLYAHEGLSADSLGERSEPPFEVKRAGERGYMDGEEEGVSVGASGRRTSDEHERR